MLKKWSGVHIPVTRKTFERETIAVGNETPKLEISDDEGFVVERRRTKVAERCEVLVVGGGPSGLCAAIAAARSGADVLLVEKFGCFGGVITTCGMETVGWYRYEGTVDSEGIGREMERLASQMGGSTKFPYNDSECLNAEHFKVIADKLVEENNIRPLLHTSVVDAIVENNIIKGIIVESKSGREAILAKRVIDCTGDCDVGYLAGARCTIAPLEHALGVSSVFNVAGVDRKKFLDHVKENPQTYEDWNSGDWQQDTTGKENDLNSPYFNYPPTDKDVSISGSWSSITENGEAQNMNLVYMKGYDVLDAKDLTKAEMEGRKNVTKTIKSLRNNVPGFEKAEIRNFAMTLGTRDSRKILARYNLTGEDVSHQARFDDSVGIFPEFIDGYNILVLPTTGRYFQVPYDCLVPADIDNLLVAGRAVSGDIVSHAATRNIMCCMVTGQAAGTACAISIKENQTTHNVDIQSVQDELKRQGARIH